jgi:hypothetical protein
LGFGYAHDVVRGAQRPFFVRKLEDGAPELDGRRTLFAAALDVGLHGRSILRGDEVPHKIGPRCIVEVLHASSAEGKIGLFTGQSRFPYNKGTTGLTKYRGT